MKRGAKLLKAASSTRAHPLPLGKGWALAVERQVSGVAISLEHPDKDALRIEIHMTEAGPVVRTRATAIQVEATSEIVARCDRFVIDARDAVSIRAREIVQSATEKVSTSAGAIDLIARSRDIKLQANDDVQLLGEQVLLNCERTAPPPVWLAQSSPEPATLPRQDLFGAPELVAKPDAAK